MAARFPPAPSALNCYLLGSLDVVLWPAGPCLSIEGHPVVVLLLFVLGLWLFVTPKLVYCGVRIPSAALLTLHVGRWLAVCMNCWRLWCVAGRQAWHEPRP